MAGGLDGLLLLDAGVMSGVLMAIVRQSEEILLYLLNFFVNFRPL